MSLHLISQTNLTKKDDNIWRSKKHKNINFLYSENIPWFKIEKKSWWYKHRQKIFEVFLKRNSIRGPILDIGAGNGYVAQYLIKKGYDVTALEPTDYLARNAKSIGLPCVINASLDEAKFLDARISNIVLFDVLEHINNPKTFLKLINKKLSFEGVLICAVPAYNFLWSGDDFEAGHFQRYTLERIQKLLKQCKFCLIDYSFYFQFLVIPILLLRSFPWFLGIRKKRSPKSVLRDHSFQNKWLKNTVSKILTREIKKIKHGKKIKFGASLIIAAKKEN